MPIQIQAPDGSIAEFPDGTPDATITSVMARSYPAPKPAQKPMSFADQAIDIGKGATKGLMGLIGSTADQASQHMLMPLQTVSNAANLVSNVGNLFSHKAPVAAPSAPVSSNFQNHAAAVAPKPQTMPGRMAERVAPFVAGAFVPGSAGARVANVFAPAIGSELAGAAADKLGAPESVVQAARFGGALAGGVAASARITPKPSNLFAKPVPTLDELSSQKDAAYGAVKASGETYSPEAFRSMMQDMAAKMDAEGFNAGNHPAAAAKMQQIGTGMKATPDYAPTLEHLDQLRQHIGRDVASSPNAGDRRMGAIMRSHIDQFIEDQGGSPDLLRARDLNTRVAKLKSLDQLDEAAADRASASGSGGNINNATRQNVIRFKNATGNLTQEEQAAAQKVIDGTPVGNITRQVGKLSPEGNGLGLTTHIVGGIATHGGSLPVAVTGFVAKRISDAITARNVQALRDLIATGGSTGAETQAQLAAAAKADPAGMRALIEALPQINFRGGLLGAARGTVPANQFRSQPQPAQQ